MGSQGVARQNCVDIAAQNQLGKGLPSVIVKGKGGPQDPHDLSVVPFVAQQLIKLLIIPGKGGFPGTALAEGKAVPFGNLLLKTVVMEKNPLFSPLCPAYHHKISGL